MMEPYDGGDGYVYACDNSMFLAVPSSTEGLPQGLVLMKNKAALSLQGVLAQIIIPFHIQLSTIFDLAKHFTEDEKCAECNGSGTVKYTYTDKQGDEHSKRFDCPRCGGSGIEQVNNLAIHPENKKPVSENAFIEIEHENTSLVFNLARIVIVALAAQSLGMDCLEITQFGKRGATVFKMPNGILSGLMPCMMSKPDAIIHA